MSELIKELESIRYGYVNASSNIGSRVACNQVDNVIYTVRLLMAERDDWREQAQRNEINNAALLSALDDIRIQSSGRPVASPHSAVHRFCVARIEKYKSTDTPAKSAAEIGRDAILEAIAGAPADCEAQDSVHAYIEEFANNLTANSGES